MEPLRTTFHDCAKNSKHYDIIYSYRVLSIPLIRCDDQVFNKIINKTDHHNDSLLLQLSPRVEPFPLNIICGDQVFDGINKQKNIDGRVFNRIIKQEIIDETDHHNDIQLLQKGTTIEEKGNTIDTKIKIDFIDDQEFKETVLNENHSSEFITRMNSDKTSNILKENPSNDIRDKISKASYLTVHNRTHNGKKTYKCDICGIRFSKASDFIRHTRTHTREKPYKCDICNRAFARSSVLRRHNKIHARKHPYKCEICDIPFSRVSHLTVHTRSHTEVKSYTCDICDQAFAQKYYLITHKRMHTREKPHKCDICDFWFLNHHI